MTAIDLTRVCTILDGRDQFSVELRLFKIVAKRPRDFAIVAKNVAAKIASLDAAFRKKNRRGMRFRQKKRIPQFEGANPLVQTALPQPTAEEKYPRKSAAQVLVAP